MTAKDYRDLAEALRRIDVAAEDVNTVMDCARALDETGNTVEGIVRSKDRLMRNRNNKKLLLAEVERWSHAAPEEYDDAADPERLETWHTYPAGWTDGYASAQSDVRRLLGRVE